MANELIHLGELDGPLLIFGGPYSNLQATRAIQQVAAELAIPAGQVICTGDVIAYCADPVETLELIRDWGIQVIRGNCEESLGSGALDCGCGFATGSACSLLAGDWYRFALAKVAAEQQRWLATRPARIDFSYAGRSIAVVHGAVDQINRFIFPSTGREEMQRQLALAQTEIVIGGHSGIPFGQALEYGAWLNSGAIGMPANDGTVDGWYLLLNTDGNQIRATWHRLKYDARSAADQMQKQGLATAYRSSLTNGLWPSMDVLPEGERKNRGVPLHLEDLSL